MLPPISTAVNSATQASPQQTKNVRFERYFVQNIQYLKLQQERNQLKAQKQLRAITKGAPLRLPPLPSIPE